MKNVLLLAGIFALFLAACPQPDDSAKVNTNTHGDENKATIVFNNTQGICAVTVYDDHRREPAHKIAEVPAGRSSEEITWTASDSYPFYFSYAVSLNGVNNFSITYIPATGKDQVAVRIDADTRNDIAIPKLEETISGPDTLLSLNSYIVIQNVSSYSFQLYRNNSSVKPDKAGSAVVNAGERVLYTISPGVASPYSLLVNADSRSFAGTVEAFEAGYIYQFKFEGSSLSLFSEMPVTVANMRPPAPELPAIPAAPSLTAADRCISAQWAETQGAERYEVYIGSSAEPPAAPVQTVAGTSALLDGLVNKTVYSVWIKAVNSAGSSGFSPPAQARPSATEVPETPARPQVAAGVSQLTVNWSASSGAASYEVYYHTTGTPPATPALSVSGTSAVLTGLNNNTLYYVWVRAVNAQGKSGYSTAGTGTPRMPATPPAAPGMPVLTEGNQALTVRWEPVEMASAYEVWAETSGNSANAAKHGADISGGLTQTTLTGLINGTTYYVWIKAKNSYGASGFSPAANASPSATAVPPPAPAAPLVTEVIRELIVSWQAVAGAEAYEVWAGTSSNPANAVKQGADTAELSASVTNLVSETTYYVWIKAKNSYGASGFSPVVSGMPIFVELYKGAAFAEAAQINNLNLGTALSYISSNAASGDNYFIVLMKDIQYAPVMLYYAGRTVGITLMADGVERTVQLASNGSLFTVDSGVTLTLENNVTLKGRTGNNAGLLTISSSGTFIMNSGEISGNTNTSSSYGGGGVVSGGTFTMNGGKISGNTSSSSSSYLYGGGVCVNGGTFIKSSTGGVITGYGSDTATGNKVVYNGVVLSNRGHAVYVSSGNKQLEKTVATNKALDSRVAGPEGGWTE